MKPEFPPLRRESSQTQPRVLDLLREEGLIEQVEEDHSQPCDVTMEKLPLPAPRSAILQTLTRADTGFVSGLALQRHSEDLHVPPHHWGAALRQPEIEVDSPWMRRRLVCGAKSLSPGRGLMGTRAGGEGSAWATAA